MGSQALILLLLFGAAPIRHAADGTQNRPDQHPDGTVRVAMKNVMYHFSDTVSAHIVRLQGTLTPTRPGELVVFDDKNSFLLHLTSAEIAVSCNSMAEVMNQDVFQAPDAPIKKVEVSAKGNLLVIKGALRQHSGLPFEVEGELTAEPDGRIRFHARHVKAAHVPMKGLLDLLGLDIAKLINTRKVEGLSADKDDLILNPEQIFPAPHIRGQVTRVRLQGNDIIQEYGGVPGASFAARETGNYMAYRDNNIRFGKLTMHDADLTLLDMDPQDPFDFFLDHYKDQLVAGYTKTTPEFGLRVYTRDYNKLHNRSTASRRSR
ncbi:MAG TPA: hypothetical protein VKV39_14205 [Candidatus Sulfotelmatobacter sp.]|nr:hypothetical protein [Candidatus Sulfotelmatobacter sp.]